MANDRVKPIASFPQAAAGGLIDRRAFLQAGAMLGAGGATMGLGATALAAETIPPGMLIPGTPMSAYGMPSKYEASVQRLLKKRPVNVSPGTGSSRTPLHRLNGIVTPNGLHFERHHNGVPDIDPTTHRLLVHGLVERPLTFTIDALLRYPTISRLCFLECGGNSDVNAGSEQPQQVSAGAIHGLVSCAEWTGVPLGLLLDEAGASPDATWLLAEGADSAAMSRSIPLAEAREHGILALFQNGERLRPEQGYPVRLLMPGWEGNLNVKWLRRLKLVAMPGQTRDETSHYTELLADGKTSQFNFMMQVKSVILNPSTGMTMQGKGIYEISGLAWSGEGRIARVEVSADGGRSWALAALQEPVLPQCFVRFRLPWRWQGEPAVLQSRATDERGHTQPTRAAWIARFAPGQEYHYNALQSWEITATGEVRNVYI